MIPIESIPFSTFLPFAIPLVGTTLLGWAWYSRSQKAVEALSQFEGEKRESEDHSEWIEEFSSFQYLPLAKLLDPEEEQFAMQTFASPASLGSRETSPLTAFSRWSNHWKWRQERAKVFALYLNDLRSNFAQLDLAAKLAVAMANEESSDLVQQIGLAELEFRNQLTQTRLALWGYRLGISRPDTTVLLDALQRMEFGIRELHLSGAAA